MLLNCGVGVFSNTQESLGLSGDQPVNPKGNQSWIFIGRTDAEADAPILWPTWCEELTHLKRPWGWERLKAGGEGDDRGWDGWMASLTQWTWVWVNFGSWWCTWRPGRLWSMGSQRVGHNWATEQWRQQYVHVWRDLKYYDKNKDLRHKNGNLTYFKFSVKNTPFI